MITVRPMQHEDMIPVYDLLVALFMESAQPEQNLDTVKGLAHLQDHVDNPWDKRAIFVAANNTEIVGVLKCFISEYWYSNDKRAVHEILYVKPEERRGEYAAALFNQFEMWAKEAGAIHCSASIFVPSLDAQMAFSKLMTRLEYKHAGVLYKKELH